MSPYALYESDFVRTASMYFRRQTIPWTHVKCHLDFDNQNQ